MTTLYSRKESGGSPEIDLVRDFEVLTHELTVEERTQFVNDIGRYISENKNHPENLRFSSADSLESKLSEITQSCDSWTGLYCTDPTYLAKIISRAQNLESHLETLRFEGGGLFYDLKNKDASWYSVISPSISVDYFVFADLNGLDSYLGSLFDFFAETQSEESVKMTFSRGAMYSDTRDFFDTDQVVRDGADPMRSHVIDTESGLDLENIPYDIFEQSSFAIASDDMVFIASCVRDLEPSVQRQMIQRLIGTVEALRISNEHERMNTLLSLSEMTADMVMMDELSFAEIGLFISQLAETFKAMNKDRKTYGLSKLNAAIFVDNIAMAADRIASIGTTTDTGPPSLKMMQSILMLSYLSADQIVLIHNKIIESGGDPSLEMSVVSGLSFDDIVATFETLSDSQEIESRYDVQGVFDLYYVQHQDDKFAYHYAEAASVINNGEDPLENLTPEMVAILITIESKGDKNAVSTTGVHFGLMQVGTQAYKQVTGQTVTVDELKGLVTGSGWRHNIEVGSQYLQWCFDYYNPMGSLAVAFGNYNWGIDFMSSYCKHAMYGAGSKKNLNPETKGYILKYLAYQRLYHANQHYQQNYLNA